MEPHTPNNPQRFYVLWQISVTKSQFKFNGQLFYSCSYSKYWSDSTYTLDLLHINNIPNIAQLYCVCVLVWFLNYTRIAHYLIIMAANKTVKKQTASKPASSGSKKVYYLFVLCSLFYCIHTLDISFYCAFIFAELSG